MNQTQRLAWRAAVAIHNKLAEPSRRSVDLGSADVTWQECRRLSGQIVAAEARSWPRAADCKRNDLARAMDRHRLRLDDLRPQLRSDGRASTQAAMAEIYGDLLGLEREFAGVSIDLKASRICVETDPIHLDRVSLGPFEIALDYTALGSPKTFSVTALEPHAAASNSDVTHPHIDGGRLCAGDGQAAIGQALEQGRVLDFFVLVRQVLLTYNLSSAYVSLDDWYGIECCDCGRTIDEDDRDYCEPCEAEVCCDCTGACAGCGRRCCWSCLSRCSDCNETICANCSHECASCGETFCQECLTDEKCQSCRDAEREPEEASATQQAQAKSDTAVHALRLGQASVSA